MSDNLQQQIAEVQKSLDALLDMPIEALKQWAKEHPQKFAQLKAALGESANKNQIRKESKTRSGDKIGISIDREEELYAVSYGGLVGYDAVTFHCVDALAAEKLFEALQNVDDIGAD
jgi:hypothetical protein